MRVIGLFLAAALAADMASAQALRLIPAEPQPDEASLKQGLAVRYAYPPEVRWLDDAIYWLGQGSEEGEPLKGLSYRDTREGELALTSKQATRVAAEIVGFVRFDNAGPAKVEFFSNDGAQVTLGGVGFPKHDGRHPCESDGYFDVEIPEPGWYAIRITWFQRLSSSCLMMKTSGADGALGWAPDDIFAYQP